MEKMAPLFRFIAGTKFLIGLVLVLGLISIFGALLNLQIVGNLFEMLLNNKILSYETIQNIQYFAVQDNQRSYIFIFFTIFGLILSGYSFVKAVQLHEVTGTGTGAPKLVFLGLLLIFASGSIDAIFGFKGTSVMQKSSVFSAVTMQNGEVRSVPFSIKANDLLSSEESAYEGVQLSILEDDDKKETFLKPWAPLRQGLYTMYYYNVQNAQPLVTFYAKNLVDIMQEPTMLGLQVGRAIENKKDGIKFQLAKVNPANTPLFKTDTIIPGFKNEGRSADYIVEYQNSSVLLRSFEHYPHMIAVNNGKNEFIPLSLGLSVSSPSGWDVLNEYSNYMAKNPTADTNKVFNKLETMKTYSEVLHTVIKAQVLKAYSLINKLKLPYVLKMDQVHQLKQVTLNVHYEPGIYFAYLGVLFLIAGLFITLIFSRGRKE